MDVRSSLRCWAVILFTFSAAPLVHGDELIEFECGFDERVAMIEALTAGFTTADLNCTSPQMTMAIVITTHQRIIQAPSSEWPDSAYSYLPGILEIEAEFEDYVNFVSSGRTNMDVRVIKREGADSVYAWVIADSMRATAQSAITNKINAGLASASDSTFYKNADGIFYCFGYLSDGRIGEALARFCFSQGKAYIKLGYFRPDDGSYALRQSTGGTAHAWWGIGLVHEVGHMFGLNHTPNSGGVSENSNCRGCMGCFNAMDGLARVGCPNASFHYIPYHGLHLERLGWADFVSISRDTTLYVRDFRVRPVIYKIKPVADHSDFFTFYNLQRADYDSVVVGEGLAVTHAVDKLNDGWDTNDIWDVEIPQPMYTKTTVNSNCPALPHVENPTNGVDTLQCQLGGNETHLWPYPETSVSSFGHGTNPWTKLYATTAMAPYDSQSVYTGLCVTTESLADSSITGKEMVKLIVNFDCSTPPPPPPGPGGGCPVVYQGEADRMVAVNNVLSRSFQFTDNRRGQAADLLMVDETAPANDGLHYFELREDEAYYSAFDAVEMQVFNLPNGTTIVSTVDSRAVAFDGMPLQANSARTGEVPMGVSISPDSAIHASAGGIVEYEWIDLPPAQRGAIVVEQDSKAIPEDACQLDPEMCDYLMNETGRISGIGLLVEQWGDGGWQFVGDLVPRLDWQRVAVELPANSGGTLRIRVRWEGTHHFRMIGWVPEASEIGPSFRLQPQEVFHSRLGSLGTALAAADGIPALLTPGDVITFGFAAPAIGEGTERHLALLCTGRYSNSLEGLGAVVTAGIGGRAVPVPRETAITMSGTMPFNPATAWKLDLAAGSSVSLRVYDANGRLVRKVVDQRLEAGVHGLRWDGRTDQGQPVGSGVYFWRFEGAGLRRGDKFVVLK